MTERKARGLEADVKQDPPKQPRWDTRVGRLKEATWSPSETEWKEAKKGSLFCTEKALRGASEGRLARERRSSRASSLTQWNCLGGRIGAARVSAAAARAAR